MNESARRRVQPVGADGGNQKVLGGRGERVSAQLVFGLQTGDSPVFSDKLELIIRTQ